MSTELPERGDERVTVLRSIAQTANVLNENGAQGVYVDGGKVIQGFLRADLIDEMTITHAPVLLGQGLPLFGELRQDLRLQLDAISHSAAGLTHSTYSVLR